ncbi:hypothetical protein M5K25_015170 [Dendrobium thyrsiflorum]|uniref:Uncharacterized protein n=1 Tax=Dendrobium thyrsiflorum TaxID=117978 RepID=A0ABD0UQ58_DENTH
MTNKRSMLCHSQKTINRPPHFSRGGRSQEEEEGGPQARKRSKKRNLSSLATRLFLDHHLDFCRTNRRKTRKKRNLRSLATKLLLDHHRTSARPSTNAGLLFGLQVTSDFRLAFK